MEIRNPDPGFHISKTFYVVSLTGIVEGLILRTAVKGRVHWSLEPQLKGVFNHIKSLHHDLSLKNKLFFYFNVLSCLSAIFFCRTLYVPPACELKFLCGWYPEVFFHGSGLPKTLFGLKSLKYIDCNATKICGLHITRISYFLHSLIERTV